MGIRHLIVIYYNSKYALAQYGQWEGHPEGQGVQVLKFLSMPGQTTILKSNLHLLQVVLPDELDAIEEECRQADMEEQRCKIAEPFTIVSMALDRFYPTLSRNTSAKILNLITDVKDNKPIVIHDVKESLRFAMHPLCEWIYIINLDTNRLNVYGGRVDPMRGLPSLQPELSEWEMLANAVPQFLVEFDIENLPKEEQFVMQINKRLIELYGEEEEWYASRETVIEDMPSTADTSCTPLNSGAPIP